MQGGCVPCGLLTPGSAVAPEGIWQGTSVRGKLAQSDRCRGGRRLPRTQGCKFKAPEPEESVVIHGGRVSSHAAGGGQRPRELSRGQPDVLQPGEERVT